MACTGSQTGLNYSQALFSLLPKKFLLQRRLLPNPSNHCCWDIFCIAQVAHTTVVEMIFSNTYHLHHVLGIIFKYHAIFLNLADNSTLVLKKRTCLHNIFLVTTTQVTFSKDMYEIQYSQHDQHAVGSTPHLHTNIKHKTNFLS